MIVKQQAYDYLSNVNMTFLCCCLITEMSAMEYIKTVACLLYVQEVVTTSWTYSIFSFDNI